mgnify:CR=1 FL=1
MAKKSAIMKDESVKVTLADGNEYSLKFDLNTLCSLQDKFGDNVLEVVGELDTSNFKSIRSVLHAVLAHEGLSENEVGSLITMGNITDVVEALQQAVEGAVPEPDEETQVNNEGK